MKSCQKSGELQEIFNSGRKTGEDSEYRESPGKIGRVGKYGEDALGLSGSALT